MEENRKFEELRKSVLPYFRRLTHDSTTAEDLLQEALLRAWERWRHKDEREIKKLVIVTGQRRYFTLLRRERGRTRVAFSEQNIILDPDHLETEELRQEIRRALQSLPELQQRVITLRVFACLTYKDVAFLVGEPLSTVKEGVRAGLSRLERILSSYFRN